MTISAFIHSDALLDRLPAVRGRYEVNADLSGRSWFRTGGPAEVLFEPEDAEDLQLFLAERPDDVNVTVIGFGSNLLVRDGGIDGVVVVLGEAFTNVAFDGTTVTAGAAALASPLLPIEGALAPDPASALPAVITAAAIPAAHAAPAPAYRRDGCGAS